MQILKKTELKAYEKVKNMKPEEVIELLKNKGLVGRGGAAFSTGKKWEFALNAKADEKFVICNADEGEPGTFKDKFIMNNNAETMIEGIMIASHVVGAKHAFIYLRGEYEYLADKLKNTIKDVLKKANSDLQIHLFIGAGAYVCGEETAIIKSIEGQRPHPDYKPPYPPVEGLWDKPTIINNVSTLTNVPQAILFDDWKNDLRLYSLSGNVSKPGIYELPIGISLKKLIELGQPKNKIKAIYFGCFGGCMPYKDDVELTPKNISGRLCAIGAFTIIAADEHQSIVDIAKAIAEFYERESCGKCTPCREGNKRVLDIINKIVNRKATKEDIEILEDLAEHIHETSLCGLGQSSTDHVITALKYFRNEFEERVK